MNEKNSIWNFFSCYFTVILHKPMNFIRWRWKKFGHECSNCIFFICFYFDAIRYIFKSIVLAGGNKLYVNAPFYVCIFFTKHVAIIINFIERQKLQSTTKEFFRFDLIVKQTRFQPTIQPSSNHPDEEEKIVMFK